MLEIKFKGKRQLVAAVLCPRSADGLAVLGSKGSENTESVAYAGTLDVDDLCAEVGHCAVVGDVKYRRGCVVVDADYALGVLHTDLVLDRAGNCNIDDHVGLNGGAGLAEGTSEICRIVISGGLTNPNKA